MVAAGVDTGGSGQDEPRVALVEAARVQVLDLASDVLGRLAPEEVPAGLRPIARFAPAKRRRLGSVALAAALDGDDAFRERVAQAVVDSSPDLVDAVRTGRPTTAADPLDVALVAYLVRPDGWQDALVAANERWSAERATSSSDSGEVDRLRSELADLRARVRSEPARVRDAVADAVDRSEAELADLRRTVRDRTRDLRAAERERDAAREDAERERAATARVQGSHDGELRRLRARVAELERGAESSRREARVERDVDDARLWLLTDTLVQAATGLRRELSLPAPDVRPADLLASAGGDSRRRRADDPAVVDQLLALPNVHVIIDGYNVTKTGYGDLSLVEQRNRLVTACAALAAQTSAEITIAFDGGTKPPAQPAVPRGVRVLFSAADEIADDLIRRLVSAEPAGRPVVVVSSDGEVVTDTARDGAWTVSSAVFLQRLG